MLFDNIPRGSIAATFTAVDLMVRAQDNMRISAEVQQAVALYCRYLTAPAAVLDEAKLAKCSELVTQFILK